MSMFLPDSYKKSIYDINYKDLKEKRIKLLIFDFDNTIIEKGNTNVDDKLLKLFSNLKKDFKVYILSNTFHEEKVKSVADKCKVNYVIKALKPTSFGFKKILKETGISNNNVCMIGDQLLTDVWGAKRNGFKIVLVDAITEDEIPATKFNRFIERFIIKRLNKKCKFERGKYYD